MKKQYISPEAFSVKLDLVGMIAQSVGGVNSNTNNPINVGGNATPGGGDSRRYGGAWDDEEEEEDY